MLKGGERKARSHHGAVEVRLNRALEEVERQRTELAALRARNEVGVASVGGRGFSSGSSAGF